MENDVTENTVFVTHSSQWFFFQWDGQTYTALLIVSFLVLNLKFPFVVKFFMQVYRGFQWFEHILLYKHNGIGH